MRRKKMEKNKQMIDKKMLRRLKIQLNSLEEEIKEDTKMLEIKGICARSLKETIKKGYVYSYNIK